MGTKSRESRSITSLIANKSQIKSIVTNCKLQNTALFSKQNKTEGKRHLVYMLLFRLNGLRAAGAARGTAHCAALQTMHLSAH